MNTDWIVRKRLLVVLAVLFALVPGASAQPQPSGQQKPVPAQPGKPPAQVFIEHRISPEEERELMRSVDSIIQFDSKATGFPIKHGIKRKLAARDEVEKYVSEHLKNDEDTQRLRRSEVVLKRFGLLPRDFELESFIVQLLREQIAGYYSPEDKTVYLLNWVTPEQQLPVMAHELTHALQDQNYALEKWVREPERTRRGPAGEVISDEEIAARHAVVEGQAMAAMVEYVLAQAGQTMLDAPNLVEAMKAGMAQMGGSPVLARAPRYIREALLFPYTYGLDFTRALLAKGGKDAAYAGVFRNPPLSTRQVMEPETYLNGERLADIEVPDFGKLLGDGYERYDVGSIGEFDVMVMAEEYGMPAASRIWTQWRGAYYYAAKPKKGGPLAVVFVSKWGTDAAAKQFRDGYLKATEQRYDVADPACVGARCEVSTVDGRVTAELLGKQLVVTEGMEEAAEKRVREAVLGTGAKADSPAVPRNDNFMDVPGQP